MNEQDLLRASDRWIRLLLHFYPVDFREEMGESIVEAYHDRCRAALHRGGHMALLGTWMRGLTDSARNGIGERARPGIRWRRTGNWGRDSQLTIRRLVRAPAFALSIIGTLTVGLGAFAVVYAVVHKVLLAPLPYERADDLYFVWRDYRAIFDLGRGWLGGPDVAALDTAGGPIQDVVGLDRNLTTMSRGAEGDAAQISVLESTPNLFDVLGVQPRLGRGFVPEEGGPGRQAVIVLGHDLWRERFGADSGALGSVVHLNNEPYTVIGIADRDFHFAMHSSLGPPLTADAYITFDVDLDTLNAGSGSFAGLVRARPGSTADAVASAVDAVGDALDERYFRDRGIELYAVGMKPDLVARVRPALLVLGLAGVFLVLVLTVNLATLLLARAAQREREFAISRALGADPSALIRATFLEGGLLGMLGGAGGALVALWGTQALVALAPLDLPRRESIAVDWEIAAVVIAVGTVLGLLAAALPAGWVTRSNLASLMSAANVRGGGGGQGRMRRAMVVVQVALSLVLLTAGGLVVRSFRQLLQAQPGFDPSGVLTMLVPVSSALYPEVTDAYVFHDRFEQELRSIPGVESVGAATALPLSASASQTGVRFPGSPANTGQEEHDVPLVDYFAVRPGYLETMGIRLLSGQNLDHARVDGPRQVLIDRTLAATFYPAGNAVGQTMLFDGDTTMIAGVVDHARQYDVHRDDRPQVYMPVRDVGARWLSWVVRTPRSPESLVSEVRAALRRADSRLPLADVRSMQQIVDDSLRQQRVSAVLIAGFALGALLLTAMGLFGVVAGAVTRRRHELAIRMALGADHHRVLRLVLSEGALLVGLGLVIGIPLIYFTGRTIAGVLVGISPFDPGTLAAVGLGLALVALAACYVPARRVTGIDPARSLGSE